MSKDTRKNPWLGLESYQEGEVLYGRDEDIRDLIQCVLNDVVTLLYGKSGIGKSSLLNAGILPAARRNGYLPIVIRFSHKAGDDYLTQINDAIIAAMGISAEDKEEISNRIREVVSRRNPERESLYEFFHRHTFHDKEGKRIKLLIIFDQFEEIFTLQEEESRKREFFSQMADVLNDIMPSELESTSSSNSESKDPIQLDNTNIDDVFDDFEIDFKTELPEYIDDNEIHFVFTVREDFLSDCEYYAAAIPSLKQNRYGLRPINEEQASQVILRPRPGLISVSVAKLIIEKVTGRSDFELDGIPEIEVDSAVLSLYLNRLYEAKSSEEITAALVEQKGGEIISDFYEEAISGISQTSVEYLEDMLVNGQGRRDNITVYDAIHDGGLTEDELETLCVQKKILRQFNYAGVLRIEYIHDILCPIIKERKEKRNIERQQEEERERQEKEKKQIIAEAEAHANRIKRRNRRIFIWAASILCLAVAAGTYYWHEKVYKPNRIHEKYYADFKLVNGWPVGINELSDEERSRTPLYYKLSHIGENAHDTDVEIMSSNSMLPSTIRVNGWPEICEDPNDKAGTAVNEILSKVKKIHFTSDETYNKGSQMELQGDDGNPLMLFSYLHVNDREAWVQYLSPDGRSLAIRDNGIDRVKMSWDSIGRIEYQRYYTPQGIADYIHQNKKTAGFYQKYSKDNPELTDYYYLNKYGLPNTDIPYNLKRTITKKDTLITAYYKVDSDDDANAKEARGDNGYSREVLVGNKEELYIPDVAEMVATSTTEYNRYGNPIKQTISGSVNDSLPPVIKWEYKGDTGLMTKKLYLTQDESQPFGKKDEDLWRWEMEYDQRGVMVSEKKYDKTNRLVYSHIKKKAENEGATIMTDILNDTLNGRFLTKIDTIKGSRISTVFFDQTGKRINQKVPFWAEDSVLCHNIVTDSVGNTTTYRHFKVDDQGNVTPLATDRNPYTLRLTSFLLRKVFDGNGNVTNMEIMNASGKIEIRMMYYFQNGEIIGRAVWGIDDKPVRCPEWEEEGFGYYKIYYSRDFDNSYVFLQPFDEWMNNSVFFCNAYIKVQSLDLKNQLISLKEGVNKGDYMVRKTITVSRFIQDSTIVDLEMPYLHILSKKSPLYDSGLRDGDRIIGLGMWQLGEPRSKFSQEWERLQSNGNREVVVTVLHPEAIGYTKHKFPIKNMPGIELNAEYHFMNLSKDEILYYEENK